MIRVDNRVWLIWSVWILLLPLKWLLSAVTAAIIHELCHIAAVYIMGGKIFAIRIGPVGTVIETHRLSAGRELICALAGPLGSLLMVFWIRRLPLIGLCALVQGVFNLLPVYPMDGGRALLRVLEILWPVKAREAAAVTEIAVLILLFLSACYAAFRYRLGIFPVAVCVLAIVNAIARKISCKQRRIKVQ